MTNDRILKRFQEAIDRGGNLYTMQDVIDEVHAGTMQWFRSDDDQAHLITSMGVYPRKTVMHIIFAFGNFAKGTNAVEAYSRALTHARENGCQALSIAGRQGWQKWLPDLGWKVQSFNYALDLDV